MRRSALLVPALLLLSACRQQVVVYECPDAEHADAAAADGGATPPDAGDPTDAGDPVDAGDPTDAGAPDSGACDPFCLDGVDVSLAVADVREAVTLTPRVTAQPGVQWTVVVDSAELRTTRAAGRPAFVASDVDLELVSTGGAATFVVRDVPPWFIETDFTITVRVREVGRAVEQSLTVDVKVRGNTVFSSSGDGRVYAVASDGLPATGGGMHANGALLDQLVSAPRTLWLGADGALLVIDDGADPTRVSRFALTGADVLLGELQYIDGAADIFRGENNLIYSMTELPDGRRVVPEFQFAGVSSAPKSRLMIWGANGDFEREVWAPSPDENWRGAATTPEGKIVVADRDLDIVVRYDPTGWLPDGTYVDNLPSSPLALLSTPDALYIGGDRFILEVPWAGGRAAVAGLPGSTSAQWRALTAYEGGRVLAVRDTQSTTQNIAIIENRQFVGLLRKEGGPVVSISGIAYLR